MHVKFTTRQFEYEKRSLEIFSSSMSQLTKHFWQEKFPSQVANVLKKFTKSYHFHLYLKLLFCLKQSSKVLNLKP